MDKKLTPEEVNAINSDTTNTIVVTKEGDKYYQENNGRKVEIPICGTAVKLAPNNLNRVWCELKKIEACGGRVVYTNYKPTRTLNTNGSNVTKKVGKNYIEEYITDEERAQVDELNTKIDELNAQIDEIHNQVLTRANSPVEKAKRELLRAQREYEKLLETLGCDVE